MTEDDRKLFLEYIAKNPPPPQATREMAEPAPPPRRRPSGSAQHITALDLHGRTVEEADNLIGRALLAARKTGKKGIRIITGRGLHSETAEGVLRGHVRRSLEKHRWGPIKGWRFGNPHEGGDGVFIVEF